MKEINKTVQGLKVEIDAANETQVREFWKWKTLDELTGDPYANITNRKEESEERIAGIEDIKEEIDT